MSWLIWKEYRLQRLVLVVALILFVIPYSPQAFLLAKLGELPPDESGLTATSAFSGIILAIITLALLGGNAIASERADRSAEFQAYLPIPRWVLVSVKLLIPLSAASIIWGIHLLVYYRNNVVGEYGTPEEQWLYLNIAFGFCAFSIAWLASAFQNSPTLAVGTGAIMPLVICVIVGLSYWFGGDELECRISYDRASLITQLLVGLLCLLGGTAYYLKRVEP